jgi:hypothetical protein
MKKVLRFVLLLVGVFLLIRMFPIIIRIFLVILNGLRIFWGPILLSSILLGAVWFLKKKRSQSLKSSVNSANIDQLRDVTNSVDTKN